MGIGAALVAVWSAIGAFGGTVLGISVGAVLQGAVVGAAIGGLTAAVTDGNILEGVLFGALGGAVTGGLTSWVSGAGSTISSATTLGEQALIASEGVAWGSTVAAETARNVIVSPSVGGLMTTLGKEVAVKGIESGISAYMENEAASELKEFNTNQAALNREHDLERIRLSGEVAKATNAARSGADNTVGLDSNAVRREELGQRKVEFDASIKLRREELDIEEGMKEDRRALFGSSSRLSRTSEAPSQPEGSSIQAKRNAISPTALPIATTA